MKTLEFINNYYNDLKESGTDYVERQLDGLEFELAHASQKCQEVELEREHYQNEIQLLKAKVGACKNILKWS